VPIVQLAQLELAPATPSAKLAALKEAYAATPGTQPGRYEFRDPAGQGDGRGASITKSAKSAGFQLSMFDGNGFSGDMQFDTMDDALTSAMSSGFIEPAPGHLADMAQLESFQEGNARTLAMEKGPAPRAAAPTPDPEPAAVVTTPFKLDKETGEWAGEVDGVPIRIYRDTAQFGTPVWHISHDDLPKIGRSNQSPGLPTRLGSTKVEAIETVRRELVRPDPVAEAPVAEAPAAPTPAAPTPAEPLSDDPVQRAKDRAVADGGLAVVPANEILDDINENPTGEDWKAARDRTLRDMDGLISFAESWTQERDANLPAKDSAGNYNPRNYPGGMAGVRAAVEANNAKRDEMLNPVFISYTLRTASGRTTKMRMPLDPEKLAGIKKNLGASRNYIFESKGDATPRSKDALRESYQEIDEQGKVTKTVDVPTPGARRVNSGQVLNLSAREKFEQRPFDYQAADGTRYVYTEDAAARVEEITAAVNEAIGQVNPNGEVRVVSQIYDGTGKPVLGASTDLGDGRLVVAALSYVDPATGETLANPNLQGTLRHETVHDLRARGMFTPQEDKLLFRSARNRRIRDDLDIAKDYGDKPDAVQAEEAIARAAEIPGKYASDPKLNSLLDRIRRFFQRLGNKLRGMGFQTFEDVFDKFESGEVGRRPDNSFPSQSSAFTTTQTVADSVPETVTLFQSAPYRSEAAATNPAENPVFKPGVWAKLFGNPREDVRAIAETLMSGVSALAASNARRPLYKKLTDITTVIGYANRGVLKRVVSELQSNGNTAGAEYVQGLLDKLATDPGSGDAKAETLEAATESQFRRSRKRLLDALGGVEGATNTENMDAVSAALAGVRAAPAHLRDTVAAVRRILDERHDYLTKAGIDVGYVRGKFFPRMLDRDAIVANPSAFLEAATRAFQTAGLPLADARTAADEWYSASTINQSMDIGGVGPGTNITKGRSLVSPQVDRIMRDFYVTDPTEALQSYLLQAARRAEYARRFHDENGKDLARELPAILQRLGVDPALQSLTMRAFESSTGRLARGAGGPLYSAASWLQTVGTISILPRSLLSSIAEPAAIGVRTGDVRDSLRAFSGTLGDLIDVAKGNPSEERRLGEALGIIGDALSDSFLQARFGGAVESKVQRKLTAMFFRAIGLQPWTEANRVAAIRIGRGFIKSIMDDHAAGVASSERMLAEFGIAKAGIPAFKTWMDSVDGMPSEADFTEESAGSEMYRVALGRFVRETVMEPESVDRPVFANHPIGRMMYGLMSFLYGFGRQVMFRTGKQLADALDPRTGLSTAERVSLAQPVVALVGLVAVHALVSDLREELFNRRKNDERTSGEKLEIALSRSGIFGPADPLYNAIRGLKYQRDLSNIVIGPGPGFFLQSIGDILAITQANSERTNTSERNAAMGAYSLLAVPAISASLGLLPGGMGMVPQALFTAGVMYGTSPGAKQRFADLAVGPKQSAGGASARGSGRGSGRG
jgi:hypothetical protein